MASGVQVASLFGLLDLQDNLTPGLQGARGALVTFGQELSHNVQSAGQTVARLGVSLTALGLPFLGLAASAIQSAGDSELAMAQLDAVLKSTGGAAGMTKEQLVEMATSLQSVTRNSDEAEIKTEAMLLTFTNIGSEVFPTALTAINDVSTAMGEPLQTAAIQVGKALNDPVNGMTALQRIGVTFNESQKNTIKSMIETGDTAGAQKVILAELTKEFGGSAVAAGETFPGKLDILKNKFDDVQEKIGGVMINTLTPLLGKLGDLATGFGNLPQPMQDTIVKVILIGASMAIAGPIIAGIGAGITALGVAIGILLTPVGLLILGIGAIVFAASQLYPGGLMQLFNDAATAASQLANIFMTVLGAAVQWIKDRIAELVNGILTLIGNILDLKDQIASIPTNVAGTYEGAATNAQTAAGLVTSGQVSPGDAINAFVGAVVSEVSGGHALGTPNVSRTGIYVLHAGEQVLSPTEVKDQQSGMTFTGPITVVANNPKEFEQKLRARYHARGN